MDRDKSFDKWRKRAAKRLPEISNKVFGLRGKMYKGCGFHWSLEKELGYCINNIMNYDSYPDTTAQIWLKVVFEGLIKRLNEIDKELTNH